MPVSAIDSQSNAAQPPQAGDATLFLEQSRMERGEARLPALEAVAPERLSLGARLLRRRADWPALRRPQATAPCQADLRIATLRAEGALRAVAILHMSHHPHEEAIEMMQSEATALRNALDDTVVPGEDGDDFDTSQSRTGRMLATSLVAQDRITLDQLHRLLLQSQSAPADHSTLLWDPHLRLDAKRIEITPVDLGYEMLTRVPDHRTAPEHWGVAAIAMMALVILLLRLNDPTTPWP